jgi:hypothetical protein
MKFISLQAEEEGSLSFLISLWWMNKEVVKHKRWPLTSCFFDVGCIQFKEAYAFSLIYFYQVTFIPWLAPYMPPPMDTCCCLPHPRDWVSNVHKMHDRWAVPEEIPGNSLPKPKQLTNTPGKVVHVSLPTYMWLPCPSFIQSQSRKLSPNCGGTATLLTSTYRSCTSQSPP